MDMGTAVAIVGTSSGFFLLASSVVKSFWGNSQEWRQFSNKLTVALSDIASMKQSLIDLSCFVCDRGPNGDGKNLRDKIIDEMMKHRGGKTDG